MYGETELAYNFSVMIFLVKNIRKSL